MQGHVPVSAIADKQCTFRHVRGARQFCQEATLLHGGTLSFPRVSEGRVQPGARARDPGTAFVLCTALTIRSFGSFLDIYLTVLDSLADAPRAGDQLALLQRI